MFANFLKRRTAELTTLEVMGLIKGEHEADITFTGDGGSVLKTTVKHIDKALREEGRLMRPDVKAFLTEARDAFKPLADPFASFTYHFERDEPSTGEMPDVMPDPKWSIAFDDACRALAPKADAIFDAHFKADITAKLDGLDVKQREKQAKSDLGLRLGMRAGL